MSFESEADTELTCEEVQRNLYSLSRGNLSEKKENMIEQHLNNCEECRGALKNLMRSEAQSYRGGHRLLRLLKLP